jgi:hypothetical protein
MVKCTQMSGFKVYMESFDSRSKMVLISVVKNFVVGADVVEPEDAINKCIKDYLSVILNAAIKQPKVKFGIVMPLQRPALIWYQERVVTISAFMDEGIKAMISDKNINNVVSINCPPEASQLFEDDMVHLTKDSAKTFLEIILGEAERFFVSDLVDLTESGELTGDSDSEADHTRKLEDRLTNLEKTKRAKADTNIARSREEMDAVTNKLKEDKLVMNGLKS